MAKRRFVSYLRVSTARQGTSGLGSKRSAPPSPDSSMEETGRLLRKFWRWKVASAMIGLPLLRLSKLCRKHRATLVIAKLDRLARNVAFISNLMESGVEFVAVDMLQANRFVVHILAAVAEQEAEAISKRTKAALAAAKARGTKLGGRRVSAERFAEIGAAARPMRSQKASQVRSELLPTITAIQATGANSLHAIAAELNAREIPTPRRAGEWSAVQVQRMMGR